ncbi:MAG: hypothetical protein NZ604_05245 [Flavobacteriales bacterium]|nr:hypothetical protein [Flavobacteriales bacterium]
MMKKVIVTFLFVCSWTMAIDFDYELTGSNQSVLIGSSVSVNGAIDDGSVIGAFYKSNDGELKCAGSGLWMNNQSVGFAIWGSMGTEDNGFAQGEELTWMLQHLDGSLTELFMIYGDGGANIYQTNSFRWISEVLVVESQGCTDDRFVEYNPFTSIDDGSCVTPVIYGCLNSDSPFYNPNANTTDDSCDPLAIYGCTQAQFYEYNEWATIDDGSCHVYWQALYYDGVWEIEDLEEEVVDLQVDISQADNMYEELLIQLQNVQSLLEETESALGLSLIRVEDLENQLYDLNAENTELEDEVVNQQILIDQMEEELAVGIDEPIAVDIVSGWNMIGFTRKVPMDAGALFQDILDDVILIKDNSANMFWPEFGFNGLGNLLPGQGYQIKVREDIDDFIFPYVVGERLEMNAMVPDWAFEMAPNHPNEERKLVRKLNLLGQQVFGDVFMSGETILYLYSDGSVEKFIY